MNLKEFRKEIKNTCYNDDIFKAAKSINKEVIHKIINLNTKSQINVWDINNLFELILQLCRHGIDFSITTDSFIADWRKYPEKRITMRIVNSWKFEDFIYFIFMCCYIRKNKL